MDSSTRRRTPVRLGGYTLDVLLATRNAWVSRVIEQRPGRALNVPTTAVSPGHSRVKAARDSAGQPGALCISQAGDGRSSSRDDLRDNVGVAVRTDRDASGPPAAGVSFAVAR